MKVGFDEKYCRNGSGIDNKIMREKSHLQLSKESVEEFWGESPDLMRAAPSVSQMTFVADLI